MSKVKYLYRENNVYKGYMTARRFCVRWCVPLDLEYRFLQQINRYRNKPSNGRKFSLQAYRLPEYAKNSLYKEEELLRIYYLIVGELPKNIICPEEYMTVSKAQALFGITAAKLSDITKKYAHIADRKSCREGDCFYKYRYDVLCHAISALDPTIIPSDMMVQLHERVAISSIKNSSAKDSIDAYRKRYSRRAYAGEALPSTISGGANADASESGSKGTKLMLTCDGEQVFSIKDYESRLKIDMLGFDQRGYVGLSTVLHRHLERKANQVGRFGASDSLYKCSDLDNAFVATCAIKPILREIEPKEYMSLWDFRAICPYLPPFISAVLYDVCHGRGSNIPYSADKPLCKQDPDVAQLLYRIDVLCSVAATKQLTPAVDLDAVLSPELKALLSGNYISAVYITRSKRTLEDLVRARDGKTINIEYVSSGTTTAQEPSTTPVQEPTPEPVQEPAPEPAPAAEQQVPAVRNASDVRAAVEIFAESMQSMEKIIKEQAELLRLIAKGMSGQDK